MLGGGANVTALTGGGRAARAAPRAPRELVGEPPRAAAGPGASGGRESQVTHVLGAVF